MFCILTTFFFRFELNKFTTADHGGTHLDAPAHFSEGGWRTQQIPVEHLVGPAAIIDVRKKAANNPDYELTIEDLKSYEKNYGKIPCGAIVLLNSDWDKYYPNPVLTFGTQTPNDSTTFHFPGFHVEAADWLARYRDVRIIATDTPSTDFGQSTTYPVHQRIGKAGICGLENVANLNKLPSKGATIYVGVMKLFDGSGGPARVIGTYKKDNKNDDNE